MKRSELVDPKAVARLMRAQVHSRLPMSGNMSGQHKSPHKGSSVEFAEYRKYVPATTFDCWTGGSMRGRTGST